MSTLSTHVLDTALGRPAAGIKVRLDRNGTAIGSGVTDSDGRVRELQQHGGSLTAGEYQLTFSVREYFAATARESFYGDIVISFVVTAESEHYHVPLLLSPFGYSTYRGS